MAESEEKIKELAGTWNMKTESVRRAYDSIPEIRDRVEKHPHESVDLRKLEADVKAFKFGDY